MSTKDIPSGTKLVNVSLYSYGHANGPITSLDSDTPSQKTLSYNIRHLPNPPRHLRSKTDGLSRRLRKEFLQHDNVEKYLERVMTELIEAINSEYDRQGSLEENSEFEVTVTVTVCCEEGRHRSVAFVEELAQRLRSFRHGDGQSRQWQLHATVSHRDIRIRSKYDSDESLSGMASTKTAKKGSRHKKRGANGRNFISTGEEYDDF
ncbi:uncharacterized protein N7469_004339 [Penicillium citrinum]|uniref:RapZ C-terminal domain-containing protein n=1 Tax=Penicillium citrinum TaxID=5077 RepID=A0A9W9P493_PENCI|nr:uncharacterized protein N7469_004339 [Penicillium citrinum]KAJ5235171.1 hypothetical protein N7469_004339 [Penicillium citrinum]